MYACNEYCKYYKNIENVLYKFIPAVHRTYYDGSITHVTGIVKITAEDYAAMPSRFDGPWLRANFPSVAESMDRFINKIKQETHGELLGNLEITPYFQSISLGFECAMFLAGLIEQRDRPLRDMLDRYELHIYKQWLRVYMRSKMIKHNKDLFESLDDPWALLEQLHIY